ncbi:MAG TPA: hypothetical protein VL490_02940, partial [Mucilaginibacter sp.]|nr:hypothetical protein [Mucilaginibacter sp.]
NFVLNTWYIWCAGAYLAEKYFNGEKIIRKNAALIAFIGFALSIGVKFYVGGIYLGYFLIVFSWLVFFEWMLYTKWVNTNSMLSKTMIAIGLCSYSIYLIHQPYLDKVLSWFNMLSPNSYTAFIKVIPAFTILFVISWILYSVVEKPSIKLGYYFRRKQ